MVSYVTRRLHKQFGKKIRLLLWIPLCHTCSQNQHQRLLQYNAGRETSPKELYALMALIAVPLFYFGGAGSAVFWIIGQYKYYYRKGIADLP